MSDADSADIHGKCTGCALLPMRQEVIRYKAETHSLRGLREEDARTIAALKGKLLETQAQLRYANEQRYGKKGEKQGSKGGEGQPPPVNTPPKKKRGRQPEAKTPKRRSMDNMPKQVEEAKLTDEQRFCPRCGKNRHSMPAEEVMVKEVEVKAHVRVIRKERVSTECACGFLPGVETASAVGPLFPGSNLGVSICLELLMGRFHDGMPMNRVLERLSSLGWDLPPGTVHSLLPNFQVLMDPVLQAIVTHNRMAKHWHADETTHRVFVEMPDKIGHRWYLWVFVAHDSTVFMMRKDRSTQAIRDHLGLDVSGIISSDRAKMYIAYAGENPRVVIAFCWVHVRRDFLKIAVEYPLLKSWADAWADRISQLFHLNHERDKHPDGEVQLREGMARFERDWRSELSCAQAHTPQKKVLSSLAAHWDGLTVFLDHPEIPMDNNTAESALRWEVIARKSIYGCRSLISAALLAAMASITTTLEQNGVSIREWLLTYLTACAKNKGKPPADISPWLPWTTKTAAVHLVS